MENIARREARARAFLASERSQAPVVVATPAKMAAAAKALRALYGAAQVTTQSDKRGVSAVRVAIGERNFTFSPERALARMGRLDRMAAKLALSSRGIVNGVLVAIPDASSLVLRDNCGIPNCPNEGHRHADLSDASLARDAHRIRNARQAESAGTLRKGRHARARDLAAVFCFHGELAQSCPLTHS